MSNKPILIILIIAVLILGAVAFTIAISALDSDDFLNKENSKSSIKWKDIQKAEYSDNLVYNSVSQRSACNSIDNHPCFRYSEVEQTRLESFKYPKIEQTRLEPCPKPKPVCPVCKEKIEQTRGEGHMDKVIQTRIEC